MGFWPFGGGGKRQRVVDVDEPGREKLLQQPSSAAVTSTEKTGHELPTSSRNESKTRLVEKSRRLSKSHTPSVSRLSKPQAASLRTTDESTRRVSRTNSQYNEKALYQQNPLSQSSLGPEKFSVTPILPTLHAKRSDHDHHLPRRKSSKRKAEDYAREREIRAMTSSPIPIPKRPAQGSGLLARDSKQIPGDLNRRLERPTSEVSLPLSGSLPGIDDMSNQNSFRIGMLAALSPRPTIRYDSNPRNMSGKQAARHNMAIQRAIAEEDVSDRKRINELADDLDAGGLRELMERDRKRRERKKDADRQKLQRKLQRRAERQREEEARKARTEAYVRDSPHSSQYVESPGSRPQTAHRMTTKQRSSSGVENPFADEPGPSVVTVPAPIRNPFEDEQDMEVMQDQQNSEDEDEERSMPSRSPLRPHADMDTESRQGTSQNNLSPPLSPVHRAADRSSVSQGSASLIGREVTPDIPENAQLDRRVSEQSNPRLSSWTTFFTRGTRRKYTAPPQGRATPSEFSNTSRESFQRKQQQPPPTVAARTFRRSGSGATPQRTMSKFREDLPELPMSPPDSRIQSPEVTALPGSTITEDKQKEVLPASPVNLPTGTAIADQELESLSPHPQQSVESETANEGNAPMVLSQSLASVDSEGSWLSGRPNKRASGPGQMHPLRQSHSSIRQPMPGAFEQDASDDVANDDYYKRLSQGPPTRRLSQQSTERKASSTIIDLQKERQQSPVPSVPDVPTDLAKGEAPKDETWHAGLGRQPTLVRQPGRAQSKEGLLNEYTADQTPKSESEEEAELEDIESPDVEYQEAPLLRARSVEYKGHARHMSAGSAKLLDIKRNSTASETPMPRTPTIAKQDTSGDGTLSTDAGPPST